MTLTLWLRLRAHLRFLGQETLSSFDPLLPDKYSHCSMGSFYWRLLVRIVQIMNRLILEAMLTVYRPGGRESIHWKCVQTKGWLGFRNTASGRLLGHDSKGKLRCSAERHQSWENFCVRMTPAGGYILLMTHFERLWHVGTIVDKGQEKLAKIGENMEDAIIWEFVKV